LIKLGSRNRLAESSASQVFHRSFRLREILGLLDGQVSRQNAVEEENPSSLNIPTFKCNFEKNVCWWSLKERHTSINILDKY